MRRLGDVGAAGDVDSVRKRQANAHRAADDDDDDDDVRLASAVRANAEALNGGDDDDDKGSSKGSLTPHSSAAVHSVVNLKQLDEPLPLTALESEAVTRARFASESPPRPPITATRITAAASAPADDDDNDNNNNNNNNNNENTDPSVFFVNASPPPFADDIALSGLVNVHNPELYSEYDLTVEHERVEAELKDVTEMIREKLNAHVDLVEVHLKRSERPLAPPPAAATAAAAAAAASDDATIGLAASLSQSLQRELGERGAALERAEAENARLVKSEAVWRSEIASLKAELLAADEARAELAAERSAAVSRATHAEEDNNMTQRELAIEKRSTHLRQQQVLHLSGELETMRGRLLEAEHLAELRHAQVVELRDKDSNSATQVAVLSMHLKHSNDALAAAEHRIIDLQKKLAVAETDAADAQAEMAKLAASAPARTRQRETSPTAVQAMAMEIERDRAERAEQHVGELEAAAHDSAARLAAAERETAELVRRLQEAVTLIRAQSNALQQLHAELAEKQEFVDALRADTSAQEHHIEALHEELDAVERERDELRGARAAADADAAAHAHAQVLSLQDALRRALDLCEKQRRGMIDFERAAAAQQRAAAIAMDERAREVAALQADLSKAAAQLRAADERAAALTADLARRNADLQRVVEQARTERDADRHELQQLRTTAREAVAGVDAAREYTSKAEAMVTKLITDLRAAKLAYDRLNAAHASLVAERTALTRDRDLLAGERDALVSERDLLTAELNAAANAAAEVVAAHAVAHAAPSPAPAPAPAPAPDTPGVRLQPMLSIPAMRMPAPATGARARSSLRPAHVDSDDDEPVADLDSLHDDFDEAPSSATRGADAARIKALLQRCNEANAKIEQRERAITKLRADAAAHAAARRRAVVATPSVAATPNGVAAASTAPPAVADSGSFWQERLNEIRDKLEREVNARLASVPATPPVYRTPFREHTLTQ